MQVFLQFYWSYFLCNFYYFFLSASAFRSFDYYSNRQGECQLNIQSSSSLSYVTSSDHYKKTEDQCDCYKLKNNTQIISIAELSLIEPSNSNLQNEDYCKQVCLNKINCR